MPRSPLLLCLALLALAAFNVGCSSTSTCDRHEDLIQVNGYVNADKTFFTSQYAVDGATKQELIWYPTNRTIDFHVGLANDPFIIQPFLAFSPDYDARVAPSAGSMTVIRTRTKDHIVVHNDTCSEFWIWLTASTSNEPFTQVPEDAGADDAAPIDDSAAGSSGAAGSN